MSRFNKCIYDLTPFTILDYPDKLACIIWFAGCNLRCGYCYNPEIVLGRGQFSLDEALNFLRTRKGLLDGVVLSGGECTLNKDLVWFCEQIKEMEYHIKLDTNGTNLSMMKALVNSDLIDYVALDFKSLEESYTKVTKRAKFKMFESSFDFLCRTAIDFEVRCTYHSKFHSNAYLKRMKEFMLVKGCNKPLYVQQFINAKYTLGNLGKSVSLNPAMIEELKNENILLRN